MLIFKRSISDRKKTQIRINYIANLKVISTRISKVKYVYLKLCPRPLCIRSSSFFLSKVDLRIQSYKDNSLMMGREWVELPISGPCPKIV